MKALNLTPLLSLSVEAVSQAPCPPLVGYDRGHRPWREIRDGSPSACSRCESIETYYWLRKDDPWGDRIAYCFACVELSITGQKKRTRKARTGARPRRKA